MEGSLTHNTARPSRDTGVSMPTRRPANIARPLCPPGTPPISVKRAHLMPTRLPADIDGTETAIPTDDDMPGLIAWPDDVEQQVRCQKFLGFDRKI